MKAGLKRLKKYCSHPVRPSGSGPFGFWLRFRSVWLPKPCESGAHIKRALRAKQSGRCGHAPSLKPGQKPKILAPSGYSIFLTALEAKRGLENPVLDDKERRGYFFAVLAALSLLLFAPVRAEATVTINGAQGYQTIAGFGVNINSFGWTNNQIEPVIDALINEGGFTLFQAIIANSNWEATNDNNNANVMNWNYYNTIYDSPDFQKLWGMMAYFNQQGISNGLILKVGGPGPLWMGGLDLTAGYENEYAETIASMLVLRPVHRKPAIQPGPPGERAGQYLHGRQYEFVPIRHRHS